MQFSILQDTLSGALAAVGLATPNRPVMEILSGVLLKAEDDRLKLAATNLETGVSLSVPARVDVAGEVVLPFRTLADLTATLARERIDFTVDTTRHTAALVCGSAKARLKGWPGGDYPALPVPGAQPVLAVDAPRLKVALARVLFAAAKDDNRPVLTGVQMEARDGELTLIAVDGYRLAKQSLPLSEVVTDGDYLIPARALAALVKLLPDEGNAALFPTLGAHMVWRAGDTSTLLSVAALDGKFPDWRAIMPQSWTTWITADRAALQLAVKRAFIFGKDANSAIKLAITTPGPHGGDGCVMVEAASVEHGDTATRVSASAGEGEDVEFKVNGALLADALAAAGCAEVRLATNGPTAPLVLETVEDRNWQSIIMPMVGGR